jgi:hypothetical protein
MLITPDIVLILTRDTAGYVVLIRLAVGGPVQQSFLRAAQALHRHKNSRALNSATFVRL